MPRSQLAPLRVVLLGCGTVGSEVYRLLGEQAADLAARAGVQLEVAGIAVRQPARYQDLPGAAALLTTDAGSLVTSPDTDIVIELMGGLEPAGTLLMAALAAGKSVVTGN